jgi:hypothetical protein
MKSASRVISRICLRSSFDRFLYSLASCSEIKFFSKHIFYRCQYEPSQLSLVVTSYSKIVQFRTWCNDVCSKDIPIKHTTRPSF